MQGFVIAGTHSGSGKTTVTLGLLAALIKKGHRVQPFKAGPDFIDTGLHRLITGRVSRNLDLWMCGAEYTRGCFSENSADADISVVEGVMGMYDGTLSTAHLAAELGLPVILVVDAFGMAESAGAVVHGFVEYSAEALKTGSAEGAAFRTSELPNFRADIAGVIFNRIASPKHYKRVKESVRDVPVFGYLPREVTFNIPHRHLGLVTAEESPIGADEIEKLADAVLEHIDVEQIVQKSGCAEALKKKPSDLPSFSSSELIKIAVAYDKAFCFYYEDNLDLLRKAGAEIVPFSPLADSKVPDGVDALYIGGGYPELHAEALSANRSMLDSIRGFAAADKPVYAECGGFMYLTEGIRDLEGDFHGMAGVFPFSTRMKKGRSRLGYREAILTEDTILGRTGDAVRGHEFHYSEIEDSAEDLKNGSAEGISRIYTVKNGDGNRIYDEGYRIKNTLGSYIHIHFGSSPDIAGHFIDKCKEHHGTDTVNRTR